MFAVLFLFSLELPLFTFANSNCSRVITDKEFALRFPNNSASNETCKFRFEGPNCPTYYTLDFEEFKLKDSANCSEEKLEVNGVAVCGTVHGITRYFAGNGALILQLKIRNDSTVKVFVKRSDCDVGLKTRFKDVEETTKTDVLVDIQKLQLVNERTEILDDDSDPEIRPAIIKSIYFFAAPEDSDPEVIPRIHHTQKETLNPRYDKFECNQNGNYSPYSEKCRNSARSNTGEGCIELDYLRGYFKSPGYPFYYPGNLNVCYRFRVQPGYCAVRIFMNDFQIEDSFRCSKDYFLIPGDYFKYCGVDLFGKTVTLDLTATQYAVIRFVSDSFWCGRGFTGLFEQIACQQPYNPINPTTEIAPTPFPTPIPREKPTSCDAVIREKRFSIRVDGRFDMCHFRLFKSSEEVCKFRLFFRYFNTDCQGDTLIINGRNYCGNLTGQTVTVPVNIYNQNDVKDITYKSTRRTSYSFKEDFIIIDGEQLSDDCSIVEPEVPAQRLLERPNRNDSITTGARRKV
ncbi:unnamed protein product [Acanthoscelides obtectus]|uniref:CUB domain-containing protein n=1 Tax=Acanthoscelides obtectus TaxID=200917 RepID=A0A9P0LAV3_ACAOB|nr:unnamed protein product [Acanthoscelides obtectus]CAK1637610.1 hypothetical protein AOBTE_LOCUS10085 [Acanthoscelides obtectus]